MARLLRTKKNCKTVSRHRGNTFKKDSFLLPQVFLFTHHHNWCHYLFLSLVRFPTSLHFTSPHFPLYYLIQYYIVSYHNIWNYLKLDHFISFYFISFYFIVYHITSCYIVNASPTALILIFLHTHVNKFNKWKLLSTWFWRNIIWGRFSCTCCRLWRSRYWIVKRYFTFHDSFNTIL